MSPYLHRSPFFPILHMHLKDSEARQDIKLMIQKCNFSQISPQEHIISNNQRRKDMVQFRRKEYNLIVSKFMSPFLWISVT